MVHLVARRLVAGAGVITVNVAVVEVAKQMKVPSVCFRQPGLTSEM